MEARGESEVASSPVGAPDSPEVLERIQSCLRFVDSIARQFARVLRHHVELEDLVGYGRAGLLAAARKYDPTRGVAFEGYAQFRIRGAVLDGVRSMALPRRVYARLRAAEAATRFAEGLLEQSFAPRSPGGPPPPIGHKLADTVAAMATATALAVEAELVRTEEGELVAVTTQDPEDMLSQAQLVALALAFLPKLPHDEAELLRRHYLEGEQFNVVAKDFARSKSWASRLQSRALTRLMKHIRRAS